MKKFFCAGILLAVTAASAATIVTTRAMTKVFPNPIRRVYEQPLFVLDKGDVVEVLQWGKPLTKIRNRKGRMGWVEIGLLDSLKRPPILRLMIDSTEDAPKGAKVLPGKIAPKSPDAPAAKPVDGVVKKWAAPVDSAKPVAQKPVDFRGDTSHISPPVKVDSAK